ncbi:MAG TPA: hypothetical protein VEB22_05590 [Phycisphaerales bacterium]|nr:hypothetical protein [Phycisphaerales bacterium]
MPQLKGSWRSTALGIAGGVAQLVIQGIHLYQGQPIDEAAIASAVTFIVFGIIVRDNGVTSEEANGGK